MFTPEHWNFTRSFDGVEHYYSVPNNEYNKHHQYQGEYSYIHNAAWKEYHEHVGEIFCKYIDVEGYNKNPIYDSFLKIHIPILFVEPIKAGFTRQQYDLDMEHANTQLNTALEPTKELWNKHEASMQAMYEKYFIGSKSVS